MRLQRTGPSLLPALHQNRYELLVTPQVEYLEDQEEFDGMDDDELEQRAAQPICEGSRMSNYQAAFAELYHMLHSGERNRGCDARLHYMNNAILPGQNT